MVSRPPGKGTPLPGTTGDKAPQAWFEKHPSDFVRRNAANAISNAITNSPYILDKTRIALRDIMESKDVARFDRLILTDSSGMNFSDRLEITKKCDQRLYYRKMSYAEYAAIMKSYKNKPLNAAIEYKDTELYRVWLSTSLPMVQKFHNEHATTDSDVIVRFRLGESLIYDRTCVAHQDPGVQHDKKVIAVHRETFAQFGNLATDELPELRENRLDHNIGLTSTNVEKFDDCLIDFARVGSVTDPE